MQIMLPNLKPPELEQEKKNTNYQTLVKRAPVKVKGRIQIMAHLSSYEIVSRTKELVIYLCNWVICRAGSGHPLSPHLGHYDPVHRH